MPGGLSDTGQSHLRVRVQRTGLLAAMSHDHVISAPIIRGDIENSIRSSVAFDVNAAAMRVMDANVSDSERSDIQTRMLGPDVLDATRYPEIHFGSESVESIGASRWRVRGDLTLHGQKKLVVLEARLENGHYRGTATVLQSDFGISPIKVAGGTIKVKDEVQIEFDVLVAGK